MKPLKMLLFLTLSVSLHLDNTLKAGFLDDFKQFPRDIKMAYTEGKEFKKIQTVELLQKSYDQEPYNFQLARTCQNYLKKEYYSQITKKATPAITKSIVGGAILTLGAIGSVGVGVACTAMTGFPLPFFASLGIAGTLLGISAGGSLAYSIGTLFDLTKNARRFRQFSIDRNTEDGYATNPLVKNYNKILPNQIKKDDFIKICHSLKLDTFRSL